MKDYFQPSLQKLASLDSSEISSDEGIQISVRTEISMVDGKMVDILVGDSGAFCHYCHATRNEANDLTQILQGFKIDRSFEEAKDIWEKLEKGEMKYGDKERAGQVHEPLTASNVRFFAILHQKLRSLDQCLKLLYHVVAKQTHT